MLDSRPQKPKFTVDSKGNVKKNFKNGGNVSKGKVKRPSKNILNSKGVDTSRISLSDLYKYMMNEVGIEGTKNAIEQHHVRGVGVRATGDYQLLNRDLNALARQISSEIGEGNLSRVNELKQKGIKTALPVWRNFMQNMNVLFCCAL